ncbi:MAG: D-threitol dehydrogenase [Alphaproteobacteria bacterium]|nr:MAG: D-threitol dehydrogenase [Alphaproteobacteria bacterium]
MSPPAIDLHGKTVVITGAGQGLGAATARLLASAGARLALLDREVRTLEQVAESISGSGSAPLVQACDISRESDVEEAVIAVARHFGGCDGLVNNAGIVGFCPLESLELAEWNRLISVNLTGTFLCIRGFGRLMLERGSGSIVTVTSTAATIPQSISGAYSASKAGSLILTRQAAMEWGKRGIRANVVAPGAMWTPMTEPFQSDPDAVKRRSAIIASGRIADPREMANVIAFLLSDLASYVNGANIDVDGGLRQMMLSLMPRPGVNEKK